MVERSPEKAGVGGSIPSLATIKQSTYGAFRPAVSFENFDARRSPLPMKTPFATLAPGASPNQKEQNRYWNADDRVGITSALNRASASLGGRGVRLSAHQFSTRMKVDAMYWTSTSWGIFAAAFRRP